MKVIQRTLMICLAITLLVSSLLMQKIAKAAGKGFVQVSQESSTEGISTSRQSRTVESQSRSDEASQNASTDGDNRPTPEQMKKHQKIIVY